MSNHARSLKRLLPIFILLVLGIALFSLLAGPDPKPARATSLRRENSDPNANSNTYPDRNTHSHPYRSGYVNTHAYARS